MRFSDLGYAECLTALASMQARIAHELRVDEADDDFIIVNEMMRGVALCDPRCIELTWFEVKGFGRCIGFRSSDMNFVGAYAGDDSVVRVVARSSSTLAGLWRFVRPGALFVAEREGHVVEAVDDLRGEPLFDTVINEALYYFRTSPL